MKKRLKIFLFIMLGILMIIQLFPSGRQDNNPVAGQDITKTEIVPENVMIVLEKACYDCHSQQVKYPWYSYIAPASWMVAKGVNKGRKHLDFGKWGELSKRKKIEKLEEIAEEAGDGSMPLKIYVVMHPEADLTNNERELIVNWAEQSSELFFEN